MSTPDYDIYVWFVSQNVATKLESMNRMFLYAIALRLRVEFKCSAPSPDLKPTERLMMN